MDVPRRLRVQGLMAFAMMLAVSWTGCGGPTPPVPPKGELQPPKVELPPAKKEDPPKKGPPPLPVKPPEKGPKLPDLPKGAQTPGSEPKTVSLPGPSRWKIVTTLEQAQRTTSLAFSVEGDLLAASGGGDSEERLKPPPAVRLFKTADWSKAGDLLGHTETVVCVLFSLDKKSLLSAGGKLTRDAELKVWDLATLKPVAQVRSPGGVIGTMAFDPAGNVLFTGGESREIKLWDFSTGKFAPNAKPFERLVGHESYVTCLAMSPDGKYLASASADLSLRLWNVAEGKLRTMLRGQLAQVNSVAFAPKGDYLASAANNGEVKIWDVQAVTDNASLTVMPKRMLLSVAFSADGRWLAAGGADGSVTIWDFPERKVSETLKEFPDFVNCVLFSPDGKYLAAAGEDGRVVVWATPK